MEWEKIFDDTSDKGLISNIYKELTKLNTNPPQKKTPNIPNKTMGRGSEYTLLQKGHTDGP